MTDAPHTPLEFVAQYPLDDVGNAAEWCRPEHITSFAGAAELGGFDAVALTEHPAPPVGWLADGHAALDPFVGLALAAATTGRVRLMTRIAVVPYRNPFLFAKTAASLDVVSNGRLLLGVGAGYLRGEFEAVGASFERRAEALDQTIRLLPRIWSGRPVTAAGHGFAADSVVCAPTPHQREVPIWVGGNSRRTRRLVAQAASGWAPLLLSPSAASRAGTRAMTDATDLRVGVDDLRRLAIESGRVPDRLDIHVKSPASRMDLRSWDAGAHLDDLHQLKAAGATSFCVHPRAESPAEATEALQTYAADVIATFRSPK